jgi:serine/threonine-protein kinase
MQSTASAIEPEAEVQSTDLQAGFIVGEYKIENKIGEGGMGAVYSAIHPMIGKHAAIKVISSALGTDQSAVGRFVQEARSVNQIGHPNIVDVFSFGELPDGRNYFVMEYLQGKSLAQRIDAGAMPLGEAIEILDQVCDALEAAHEKQIVHRDLKPDNVYLAAVRGNRTLVKLLDFGIAKLSVADGPGGQGGIAKTRTGMIMGTPGYISPEQARGKNVDHRTDIYALGAMAFEIVTGRLPFVADNAMDIVLAHMVQPPPRASTLWAEIPAALDDLLYKMLDKDPNNRPTLSEVRAVFAQLVTSGLVTLTLGRGVAFGSQIGRLVTPTHGASAPGLAQGTQPAAPPPSAQQTGLPGAANAGDAPTKKRGNRWLLGVAVGGALLAGAAIFLALRGGGDEPGTRSTEVAASSGGPAPGSGAPGDAIGVGSTVARAAEPTAAVVAAAPLAAAEVAGSAAPPQNSDRPPEVDPPKPAGALHVEVSIDKARITVDGKPVALVGRKAVVPVKSEGKHTIEVTAPGHQPFHREVEVRGGAAVPVIAKLERKGGGTSASIRRPPASAGTASNPPPAVTKPGHKDDTIDPF